MEQNKKIMLFSGGKDGAYALLKMPVDMIVSFVSLNGQTQFHAGPEVPAKLLEDILKLINIPFKQIAISSTDNYLYTIFSTLAGEAQAGQYKYLITGDLFHPYTNGIGDMLAGALGLEIIRPAKADCPTREQAENYMRQVIAAGIKAQIISIRDHLPEELLGLEVDNRLIDKLVNLGIDPSGEGGEYQTIVTGFPLMPKQIIIDKTKMEAVLGRNQKEKFKKLDILKYHIE